MLSRSASAVAGQMVGTTSAPCTTVVCQAGAAMGQRDQGWHHAPKLIQNSHPSRILPTIHNHFKALPLLQPQPPTLTTYSEQLCASSSVMHEGQATATHVASAKGPPCSRSIIVTIAAVPPPNE